MAELPPQVSIWLAMLGLLASIFAASLTAFLTHVYASRREDHAKRMKIVGWLEWLRNFLEQVEKELPFPESQKIGKLPWWADNAMKDIGDSLYRLPEAARENLMKLINKCWVDEPAEHLYDTVKDKIVDVNYNSAKVKTMKMDIEELIKQIKDP